MAFLKELNVAKAAADLWKKQKLAYKTHLDAQKARIEEFQQTLAQSEKVGDLDEKLARLQAAVEEPLALEQFAEKIPEYEHLEKAQG
jgi:hypothetical protein